MGGNLPCLVHFSTLFFWQLLYSDGAGKRDFIAWHRAVNCCEGICCTLESVACWQGAEKIAITNRLLPEFDASTKSSVESAHL